MFHCAVKSYNGEHIHKKNGRSAQYAFECCKGNMCNENQNFPVLPEPYTEGNNFSYDFRVIKTYTYLFTFVKNNKTK